MIASTTTLHAPETKRGIQFERVFRAAEFLRSLRFGATLDEINREVCEQTGHPWCDRTTRRDLNLLEYLGLAHFDSGRWRWADRRSLLDVPAAVVGRVADEVCRDQCAHQFR